MNRNVALRLGLLAVVFLNAVSVARGQAYYGTVLYSMSLPQGLRNISNIESELSLAAYGGEVGGYAYNGTTSNALVWSSSGAVTNLDPTGSSGSVVEGVYGNQQVGQISGLAALWNGTAGSAVNLMPGGTGFTGSNALATDGTQQVGDLSNTVLVSGVVTYFATVPQATLWNGTAGSAVSLAPAGSYSSAALGISGLQQVGFKTTAGLTNPTAVLWTGSAQSAVNLAPQGFVASFAYGTNGAQQVGMGQVQITGRRNALLWNGTAASAVDLNPTNISGVLESEALATNGTQQVGDGYVEINGGTYVGQVAVLWNGTAASATNLQTLLPSAGTWSNSTATSIDSSGNVWGNAQGTLGNVTGEFAVEWTKTSAVSWGSAVSGNWQGSSNWSPTATPVAGVSTTFNTGSATPYTVTLSANSAASNLNVQDNVTIQKAGFNLSVPGAVTISGTVSQSASLALAGGGSNTFGSLSISNGQLDLTDNAVVINYGVGNPSPVGSIGNFIAGGYNGGTWNGVGIVSSKVASVNAAHGNPNLYTIGYADASDLAVAAEHFTPGTVVVEPAIVGDANLDGVVNFTDFLLLSAGFNQPNTAWDQGNFNYGTKTDFGDFLLLSANFNNSTSLDNAQLDAMNQFAKGFGDTLVPNSDGIGFTVVPEPATIGVLCVISMGLLARRRRRCEIIFRHR